MSNRFKKKDNFENNVDFILNAGKDIKNDIKTEDNIDDNIETKVETNDEIKDAIYLEKEEKDEMVRVSFYIKKSQHELIKKYAKKTNRNKNEFVRYMIDKFFAAIK